MATFTSGPQGFDISGLNIGDLLDYEPISATPTQLVLDDLAGEIVTFTGFGFTYSGGAPTSGTVTGIRAVLNGTLLYEASGFSTPVSSWLAWIQANDTLAAYRTVLAGDDVINGSAAADRLFGFAGNDSMLGGGGADRLEGGDGADTVMAGAGNDTIVDTTGSNYLRGEEGDDVIQGGDGFDDAHGNQGNDIVRGGGGNDWVVGGKDDDQLYGEVGDDIAYGNLGNDTVDGGDGADWVRGGQGDDIVRGGAGDDLVWGDRGSDTLSGGGGADTFSFFAGAGTDLILDFNGAEGDRIRFEGAAVNYSVTMVGNETQLDFGNGDVLRIVGTFQTDWLVFTG